MKLKATTLLLAAGLGLLGPPPYRAAAEEQPAPARDIGEVEPDLVVPPMVEGEPGPGRRVRQTLPGYEQTDVYHALYLPTDWRPERRYPLIVEYAGNRWRSPSGDESSGAVEGSKLGYGMSGGEGVLWVCLPYLNDSGESNVASWWGDKPSYNAAPTIAYCKQAVSWICDRYGADPDAVVLAGFSRGAIACNFIGLHDDEIARRWRAFVAFSHYDGVVEGWPYAGADRRSALARLERLGGRPQFICAESAPGAASVETTRKYLESTGLAGAWTFVPTGFRNHDDAWILRPSPARTALRAWLEEALAETKDESP